MQTKHAFKKACMALTGLMICSLTATVAAESEKPDKAPPFEGKRIEINEIHL